MGNPDKRKTKLGEIWAGSVQGKSRKSEKTPIGMTRFPQLYQHTYKGAVFKIKSKKMYSFPVTTLQKYYAYAVKKHKRENQMRSETSSGFHCIKSDQKIYFHQASAHVDNGCFLIMFKKRSTSFDQFLWDVFCFFLNLLGKLRIFFILLTC